jgi:hypothetical protein
MDIAKFRTDPEKEKGVWVPLVPGLDVKVAYSNSKAFNRAREDRMRPYVALLQRTRDPNSIPESDRDAIALDLIVKHVLLDWRGLEFEGETLEYSQANARMVLEAVPDFRAMVEEKAATVGNFVLESAAKNSEPVSVGT